MADLGEAISPARDHCGTETSMGVVIFIVLTVAAFALLGLAQKLVERL